ncbi:MAG: beta-channel forming cytolysin [Sarcina sp.]
MNKLSKLSKISGTLLISALLSGQVAFASDLGLATDVTMKEDGKGYTILTQNTKQITNYTSTASTSEKNYKATVDATFVDDKYSAEQTTILSLKGFIPANKTITTIYKNDGISGVMQWPSKYKVEVHNPSVGKSVKIVDSLPKNSIDTKTINNSISYTIGGGIDTKEGLAALNSNYTFSKSVSYDQPDYKTTQTRDSNELVRWNTDFTETKDGYGLNSWNYLYGNEIFMKSRHSGTATTNFSNDSELSSLITGGFSPNMGLVLTAPNGVKNSFIEVTLSKVQDSYFMRSAGTHWVGVNYPDNYFEEKETFKFKIDWKNHKITPIKN